MERTKPNKFVFIILLGLFAFVTIAYGGVHQAVLAAVYILIALLALGWAYQSLRTGAVKFSNHPLQLPLLAAAVYGFLQIIPFGWLSSEAGVKEIPRTISLEPFATLLSAVHFVMLFVFFAILLAQLDSEGRLRKVAIVCSAFGFIYAFYAVLQSVLSPEKIFGLYERWGASVFGSFVNRNHFAAWMEMAVALPLGLLFSGAVEKDKRLLYGTSVALMGASIIVSGSRGGLIAFISQIIFLTLVTYAAGEKKLGLRLALAASLLVVVIGGAIFIGGETSLTRIAEEQPATNPSESRSHIWAVSMSVIEYGMPLGVGLGAFGTAYTLHDSSSGLQRVEQAHNDYLQVLTDAGIPGAIIGAAFLFLIVRSGRRVLSSKNAYCRALGIGSLTGIVGVLTHSLFDFVLHTTAVAMFFLILLSMLCASEYFDPRRDGSDVKEKNGRRRRTPRTSSVPQRSVHVESGEIPIEQ